MISMTERETSESYALSDLVIDRRARLRKSLATLATDCVDPDTGEQEWKVGRLHRLEHRLPIESPTAPMLRALAAGLELPQRQVQDAAGEQFLGVVTAELDTEGKVRLLTTRANSLSPEDLERLLAIAETFPIRRDGTSSSDR